MKTRGKAFLGRGIARARCEGKVEFGAFRGKMAVSGQTSALRANPLLMALL